MHERWLRLSLTARYAVVVAAMAVVFLPFALILAGHVRLGMFSSFTTAIAFSSLLVSMLRAAWEKAGE